jgi:hypothetical protein
LIDSQTDPTRHTLAQPLSHSKRQVAPVAHVCVQPVVQVKSQLPLHVCVQFPPLQSASQLEPAAQVCSHPPWSQSKSHGTPTVQSCSLPPPLPPLPPLPSVSLTELWELQPTTSARAQVVSIAVRLITRA